MINYTWSEFENDIIVLKNQIILNGKPDIIMGLTRGGACLATTLSYKLNVPISYYDPSNRAIPLLNYKSKVLIVDDINDTGKTLDSIVKKLKTINKWTFDHGIVVENSLSTIKTAVIYENETSIFKTDFYSKTINRDLDKRYINFPWE